MGRSLPFSLREDNEQALLCDFEASRRFVSLGVGWSRGPKVSDVAFCSCLRDFRGDCHLIYRAHRADMKHLVKAGSVFANVVDFEQMHFLWSEREREKKHWNL